MTSIILIFMIFHLFLLMLETDVHRCECGAVVCSNTLGKKKAQSKLILSKYLRVSFRDNALYCSWQWPRHTKSCPQWLSTPENHKNINPYPTAFPYGNGMFLHFYQQQESSTTKTVHKVINKGLKTYV